MRRRGTIIKWNDEKGFGFIAPDDRTDDVFLHLSALIGQTRRPKLGDGVHYELGYDLRQRRKACDAVLEGAGSWPRILAILSGPLLILGTAVYCARQQLIPTWVALLYLLASAAAATACALDKFRAQRGSWRISEGTLHLFELAGGWPGAFAAQRILRHKTRKLGFQVVFWVIVLAHIAFWIWFTRQQHPSWP